MQQSEFSAIAEHYGLKKENIFQDISEIGIKIWNGENLSLSLSSLKESSKADFTFLYLYKGRLYHAKIPTQEMPPQKLCRIKSALKAGNLNIKKGIFKPTIHLYEKKEEIISCQLKKL